MPARFPGSALFTAIREMAAKHPEGPAMTFLDSKGVATTYTARELLTEAGELAARLARHGYPRGALIGLLVASQESQVLHYLAALACGLAPAILTPPNRKQEYSYYAKTIHTLLENCGFQAVITDSPDLANPCTALEPFRLEKLSPCGSDGAVVGEDAAFVQFSSGTTGIKKGVVITAPALQCQVQAYAEAIGLNPGDRIVSWLPLYHDMGFIACMNMPLLTGVHTVMMQPLDWVASPGMWLRAMSDYRGTLAWHPNFAYSFLAQRVTERDCTRLDLSAVRGLVNCSEPLTEVAQARFASRFGAYGLRPDVFWGCYAMAETTFALTHGSTASTVPGMLSSGAPIEGVELRIADGNGDEAGEGACGEIWARSPFTMAGYYRNADATRAAIVDGWYRTGDLGFRRGPDLFVTGRKKDLIIVGGANLYPQDLENLTAAVEGIIPGRVAAFAEFDAASQTERAVVLAESEAHGSAEGQGIVLEVRRRLASALGSGNIQVQTVPPGWIIKSSSGKVARSANREKWNTYLEARAVCEPAGVCR